nr:translation initiation factor IF-2 subunit gamma [Candidatus Njordarchaeum guaymaensis]
MRGVKETKRDNEASRQAELNIGTCGHVDHGKTTLVKALSGEWTIRHSEEIRRGVTIKLGYADTTIMKCSKCSAPECYTTDSIAKGKCPHCGGDLVTLRKVSFVDSPGHEILMATMLSGAAIIDGAILVIAANESCPQPQTREHLVALEIIGVKNIVVIQNKIELVPREKVMENYKQITQFVKGTRADGVPIIPVSAIHGANIDYLIKAIEDKIPTPQRDPSRPSRMYVARSFDVNKPGTEPKALVGGVIGGSLLQGVLKVEEEIEIRPGVKVSEGGKEKYTPIFTKVTSLSAGKQIRLTEAKPGGLIGVGTLLDPSLTKADGLVGSVVGKPGTIPAVWDQVTIHFTLLERAVGTVGQELVTAIRTNELLMLNAGTATTAGLTTSARSDVADIKLNRPICAEQNSRVAISRKISGRWRLIGWGKIS